MVQRTVEVTVDREEITVVGTIARRGRRRTPTDAEAAERGRIGRFREDTRAERIEIAREAQHRFDRKVSWACASATARSCSPTSPRR